VLLVTELMNLLDEDARSHRPQLIALRAVQGAAAALVIPQTIGMIRAMFAGPALARAMGTIGPVMGPRPPAPPRPPRRSPAPVTPSASPPSSSSPPQ
jgi:hypothetical protein